MHALEMYVAEMYAAEIYAWEVCETYVLYVRKVGGIFGF